MNLSAASSDRPIGTSLLSGVAIVGVAAYPLLPVAPLPSIDFPTLQVQAALPGREPRSHGIRRWRPRSRADRRSYAGVAQMTSSNSSEHAIAVQFDLNRDIEYGRAVDVQAAINAASGQLPNEPANPPTYRKVNPADPPILDHRREFGRPPHTQVEDFAET